MLQSFYLILKHDLCAALMTHVIKELHPLRLWHIIHSRPWYMFLSPQMYTQDTKEPRGKAILGNSCVQSSLVKMNRELCCYFQKFCSFYTKVWKDKVIHPLMPVKTSWMSNHRHSALAVLLCNCFTQVTCRCWMHFVSPAGLCKQSLSALRVELRTVTKLNVWIYC